jgi:hypothetical protein
MSEIHFHIVTSNLQEHIVGRFKNFYTLDESVHTHIDRPTTSMLQTRNTYRTLSLFPTVRNGMLYR